LAVPNELVLMLLEGRDLIAPVFTAATLLPWLLLNELDNPELNLEPDVLLEEEDELDDPVVNLEPDVLPDEEDELDDPPLMIEFPLEESPVLELKPANPEVNLEPDVLPEEDDIPLLEENESPAFF